MEGRGFSKREFVGIGVGATGGIWIWGGAEIDNGIEFTGHGGIKCLLGLGEGILIQVGGELDSNVRVGQQIGALGTSVGFGLGIYVSVVCCTGPLIKLGMLGVGRTDKVGNFVRMNDGICDESVDGTGEFGR